MMTNWNYSGCSPTNRKGEGWNVLFFFFFQISHSAHRVFLTDLTGTTVLDSWDLPMENPEGIAIDNTVDPPMMYIVTDPSSPHGKQYIAAMFSFLKPKQGTGRAYSPSANEFSTGYCEGCATIWEEIKEMSTFISSDEMSSSSGRNNKWVITLSTLLGVLVILFVALVASIIVIVRWRRGKQSPTEVELDLEQVLEDEFLE